MRKHIRHTSHISQNFSYTKHITRSEARVAVASEHEGTRLKVTLDGRMFKQLNNALRVAISLLVKQILLLQTNAKHLRAMAITQRRNLLFFLLLLEERGTRR